MKRPQLITVLVSVLLIVGIYFFGRIIPKKQKGNTPVAAVNDHTEAEITIDTILVLAKKQLTNDQVVRLNSLEHSISRGDVKDQQIKVYQQLAHFWYDSARVFEPYAWYTAQAARLENSEKTLTFAAHLFLENLQSDEVVERRKWKALQAKDLFERTLSINPANDSAKVGLGACYLFGNISATPMDGIIKIREVVEKDSNNMYAQLMLGKASVVSGQFDKAISRLLIVNRHQPANLDAILLLADVNERSGDKKSAIQWYKKSLPLVNESSIKTAILQRIAELEK
jgi:tetratricopeptide (TPR) repeat protein